MMLGHHSEGVKIAYQHDCAQDRKYNRKYYRIIEIKGQERDQKSAK